MFAVLLATSLLVWWQPLASTLILALERDAYTHILLIAPLSVALICLERNTVQLPFEGSAGAGTFLLTIGLHRPPGRSAVEEAFPDQAPRPDAAAATTPTSLVRYEQQPARVRMSEDVAEPLRHHLRFTP